MNPHISAIFSIGMLLSALGCGGNQPPPRAKSAPLPNDGNLVRAGTQIKVRTAGLISTRSISPGERIEAELADPVEVQGETKVPAGATAILSVVDSKPGIPLGSSALMLLKVTQLRRNMADKVDVNTAGLKREGPEIAAGTVLTFRLETPAQLETKK